MEQFLGGLVNNGIAGIMLAFFVWYLVRRDSEHKEERKVWIAQNEQHFTAISVLIDKNTTAFKDMEKVISQNECKFKQ